MRNCGVGHRLSNKVCDAAEKAGCYLIHSRKVEETYFSMHHLLNSKDICGDIKLTSTPEVRNRFKLLV